MKNNVFLNPVTALKAFILLFLSLMCFLIFAYEASAKIIAKDIEYKDGDTALQGYLAYDDSLKGKLPGILIVHEWNGLGNYVKNRAQQLAGLGYVAFCADIYGKGIRPQTMEECAKQATIYRSDRQLMRRRANAGLEELKKQKMTDGLNLAAIGYCFGGGVALELARSGSDIKGAVSFHGNLDTPNLLDAKNIKAKILVLHGAQDPYTSSEQISTFQKEMKDAGIDYQFIIYSGAVHRFTNPEAGNDPSKGTAYNEKADKRSWQAMKDFYNEIFAKK
jgi:dienelactone hydrolase